MSELQAFNAMTNFLDLFYNQTKSDDIGSLLGDMSFISDGATADPAAWYDWVNIVTTYEFLDSKNSFNAMKQFVTDYGARTNSEDINKWLSSLYPQNKDVWSTWISCINEVLNQEDAKKYLDIKK